MKMFYRLFLLIVVLTTSFIPQAMGSWINNSSHLIQTNNQQDNISEQAAVTIAQQHINGRVLAINRVNKAYRIKILSNKGTVHIVSVNATDGTIISSR